MAIVAGKLGIQKFITQTQSLGEFDIDTDGKIKFTTVHAGSNFTIEVKGKIAGQSTFTFIANIVGPTDQVVNVIQWDFLQINVTVYDSTSHYVDLNASGFNDDSAALSLITIPNGDNLVGISDLKFTSLDNSVVITGNSLDGSIDFAAAGGGTTTKYTKTVILGDWTGPSSGEYTLTIPFSFHGIPNPQVVCYEAVGLDFEQIIAPIKIDASNNITITSSQTPDTRFIGKIVIE
jgi:hypothetical protein